MVQIGDRYDKVQIGDRYDTVEQLVSFIKPVKSEIRISPTMHTTGGISSIASNTPYKGVQLETILGGAP